MRRNFKRRHKRLFARITAGIIGAAVLLSGCRAAGPTACIINRCPDIQPPNIKTVGDAVEALAIYRAAYDICNGTAETDKKKGFKNDR